MKKLVFVISLILSSTLLAQVEASRPRSYWEPQFYFNILNFASNEPDKGRLDIYVQVPNELLQFVKIGDNYIAKYEVTADIFNKKGKLVHEEVWTNKVVTGNFKETRSKAYSSVTQRFVKLPFGEYKIVLKVMDMDSRKVVKKEKKVKVRRMSGKPLAMSDMMLVSKLTVENGVKSIVPNIPGIMVSATKGFYLFFEVYNNEGKEDSVDIVYRIVDSKHKGRVDYKGSSVDFIKPGRNAIVLEVKNPPLPFGDYVVYVEVRLRSNRSIYAVSQRFFKIRWRELPSLITDLDKAIEQLVYIAKPSEIDYIMSAPTEFEKEKRFLEFWKKRDPTPKTPRNELMEEYYGRVKYANEHFSHYIEGWKTDRGMVYIIFGPPSSVDRHPFDVNSKPYEIWYYYDLNRRFIFVDETGFGDYRLVTPIWDRWNGGIIWR